MEAREALFILDPYEDTESSKTPLSIIIGPP